MSVLKTIGLALALAGGLLAATAQAVPFSPSERARLFAACAGRYSAETEHGWLFGGAGSEPAARRRDHFAALLEAVLPDAVDHGLPARQAMAWRIEAKAVHRALLSSATFDRAPERSGPARRAAEANLAQCDGVLAGA